MLGQGVVPDKITLENSLTDKNEVEDTEVVFSSQSSLRPLDTSLESLSGGEEFLMYRRRMLNHINSLENIYLSILKIFYFFFLTF